jgi:hypothetical protein
MFIIAGPTEVDSKIVMTVLDFSSSGHMKCESWAINLQDETVKNYGGVYLVVQGYLKEICQIITNRGNDMETKVKKRTEKENLRPRTGI